jgi:hypothetical protein
VGGSFILFKHLQRHSILMSGAVYGVRGIYTPLEVMCPHVPMFVETVLLPFRDAIITDGLMRSPPMHISFGGDPTRLWVWCGVRTGFAAPHGRVGWRRGQLEHDALAVVADASVERSPAGPP